MSLLEPICWINGQLNASVSPHDRGLAYGDGLFETILYTQNKLPFFELHVKRLQLGCDRLSIPLDFELLNNYLNVALTVLSNRQYKDGVVKIIVTRGQGGRGHRYDLSMKPSIIISWHPYSFQDSQQVQKNGAAVKVLAYRLPSNPRLAGIKHLNRLDYVLASEELNQTPFDDGVLLGINGNVVESTNRNIFILSGGALVTPYLLDAGVAGILRHLILDNYAAEMDIDIVESSLSLDSVLSAEEVFLTNSVSGIWPVKSINNKQYDCGYEFARKLQHCLDTDVNTRIKKECCVG